jgi:hypothetical protein
MTPGTRRHPVLSIRAWETYGVRPPKIVVATVATASPLSLTAIGNCSGAEEAPTAPTPPATRARTTAPVRASAD